MKSIVSNFPVAPLIRECWFHGYTYNATPGSRTALSSVANDTIRNGHVFCFDPEAYIDRASLPTGMVIKGDGENARMMNVCKPTTGVLRMFAGVVLDNSIGPDGLRPDRTPSQGGYKGGRYIKLAYFGCDISTLVLGDFSSTAFDTDLAPQNGQWYLGITAVGTNGANIPSFVGFPGVKENVAAAAVKPCYIYR